MNTKKCFFAAQIQIKKNATRDGKQRYKCTACNKPFSGGSKLDPDTLWQPYSVGKQTDTQLAGQYGCSIKTIRRHLAKAATQATCATLQVAAANLMWISPILAASGALWSSTTPVANAPWQ